jgi:hypothetical protein
MQIALQHLKTLVSIPPTVAAHTNYQQINQPATLFVLQD